MANRRTSNVWNFSICRCALEDCACRKVQGVSFIWRWARNNKICGKAVSVLTIEIALLISVVSVCFSIGFGLKNSKRTDTKDIEERVKENTRINTKLDSIGQDTREIKTEISEMRKSINSHDNKIATLEASCKSAHHRLDTLEERMNGKE